jgi:hypothetical protein
MSDSNGNWTNENLLREFLAVIVKDIYESSSQSINRFRDASTMDDQQIKEQLVNLQLGLISGVFGLIDGSRRPREWPGVKLVHGETGEVLTEDLNWELSAAESLYLDEIEPPADEE